MQLLKNLIILAIIVAVFILLRPKIMHWLGMTKKEFRPIATEVNTTYQKFKSHDVYEKEKKIIEQLEK